jgi:hypothetical protein
MLVPDSLPASVPTLVIGAGVHGLSTAWHLAKGGEEVLVIDKTGVAAGASGIACGVVRNNYFQPAMQELMAACVEIWESEAETLHYHPTGYVALGPGTQESDLIAVYERQQRIGYPSQLHVGLAEVERHMRSVYSDWRAPGLTVCLHEHAGGYAFNRESMFGLADLAQAAGARIMPGVEVTGFRFDGSRAVTHVDTDQGTIQPDKVVVAVGPWIASLWRMLELPDHLDVRERDGAMRENLPMWTYWYLQEGEVAIDPATFVNNDGKPSAVLHVDSDQPLESDDRKLITEEPWGVYFKPLLRGHVAGGAVALPEAIRRRAALFPPRSLRWGRRVHRRQLPGVRLHEAQRVRGRRLQSRLQDDRGGARGGAGARRRAFVAASPLPLRTLRDRRPTSGLKQPLSVELTAQRHGPDAECRASA